jgi:Family of unknown function (DUF6263)
MTVRRPRMQGFALALVLILMASAARADTTLKWKFKQGDVLNYVMSNSSEQKMDVQGQVFEIGMKMVFDLTWTVKSVAADGTAEMQQTVDRVQVKMTSPFANMDYDSKSSTKPEGPIWEQMEPMMTAMLGQTFSMKVSPAGKVTDIKLPEKLAKHFADQKSGGAGGGGRRGLGGLMGGFSESGVKEMIQKAVLPLPEKPVAANAKWNQTFENVMPGAGKQKTDVIYSYSGSEQQEGKSLEKITSKIQLTFEPAENSQVDVEITEQDGSATVYFDTAAGRTVKAIGKQKMKMEIAAPNREMTREVTETNTIRMGKSPDKPAKAEDKKEKADEKK